MSDQPEDYSSTPPQRQETFRRVISVAIFLAIVTGVAYAWQLYDGRYHLATVQPGVLYRDGARKASELQAAIAKVRPRTVVCLVDDHEFADPAKPQFREEIDLLKQLGIRMERIPVQLGGWPSSEDVQKFLATVAEPGNQPVLVHCAQGVRRTGMMVAAYQVSVLGYDKDRAKAEIMTFGHSQNTIDDIRRFIDGYDAKTRTVTGVGK